MAFRSQISSRRDWIFTSSVELFFSLGTVLTVDSSCYREIHPCTWNRPRLRFSGGSCQTPNYKDSEETQKTGFFKTYLFIRAVVHEHHVIFSSHFLKTGPMFPLILGLIQEPVTNQTRVRTVLSLLPTWDPSKTQTHFFLKKSLAFSRSPPQGVRLFWPTLPTDDTRETNTVTTRVSFLD